MQTSHLHTRACTRDFDRCVADTLTQLENEAEKKKYTWLPDSIMKHVVGSPNEHQILRAVLSESAEQLHA